MPEDESPFWNPTPSALDHLPADLPDGAEGDVVVPAIDLELLAYLQRVANLLQDEHWIRPALDRVVDEIIDGCEVLLRKPEMVTVKGDPERMRRLLAAVENLQPVLRRIVALQQEIGP
jgi:hypothetical protein